MKARTEKRRGRVGVKGPRGPPRRRATAWCRRSAAESGGDFEIWVRLGIASTRQEIEKHSGLGRAIVADRLATLIDLGLVEEGERGPATGGRAPRLLHFRSDSRLILTALLDQTTLSVGVASLSGKLLLEHHEAADVSAGPVPILERLETLFDWVLDQQRGEREVWGIGIGVPGPVELSGEPATGPTIHFMPRWADYPVAERLQVRHRAPVWIQSSVQMMTLGEQRSGSGVGAQNFLFVKLGAGISAGLMSEGRLHQGAQGGAGLIGHISTGEDNGAVCRCGNAGCLEVTAGGEAIAREALLAARDGRSRFLSDALIANGEIAAADVAHAAQLGDAFSAELLSRCGRLIGTALAGLTNAFNPSLIVLGGGVAQAGDILLAAIRESIYRHSHPLVTRDLRIVRSQMGSSAGLVGSALAVADSLFSPASLDRWIHFGSPLREPDFVGLLDRAERSADQQPRPPAKLAQRR